MFVDESRRKGAMTSLQRNDPHTHLMIRQDGNSPRIIFLPPFYPTCGHAPRDYPPAGRHDGVQVLRRVQVRHVPCVENVIDVLQHDLVHDLHIARWGKDKPSGRWHEEREREDQVRGRKTRASSRGDEIRSLAPESPLKSAPLQVNLPGRQKEELCEP